MNAAERSHEELLLDFHVTFCCVRGDEDLLLHRSAEIGSLTELIVLVEVKLVVDNSHADLLIFRPAGTPAANHRPAHGTDTAHRGKLSVCPSVLKLTSHRPSSGTGI